MICASVLYYGLDIPMMPDAEYDALTVQLAADWASLSSFRQWQLGSADAIRTTGNHVKVTLAAVGGVNSWLRGTNHPVRAVPDRRPLKARSDWLPYWLPAHIRSV